MLPGDGRGVGARAGREIMVQFKRNSFCGASARYLVTLKRLQFQCRACAFKTPLAKVFETHRVPAEAADSLQHLTVTSRTFLERFALHIVIIAKLVDGVLDTQFA